MEVKFIFRLGKLIKYQFLYNHVWVSMSLKMKHTLQDYILQGRPATGYQIQMVPTVIFSCLVKSSIDEDMTELFDNHQPLGSMGWTKSTFDYLILKCIT